MNAIDLALPVTRVTLLEDRAQVRRAGRVVLAAGSHRLRVEPVSPVAVDRSLAARLPGARVDDARVVRSWRIGSGERPPDVSGLEQERDRLAREAEAARQRLERLAKERTAWEQAADLHADGVQRELPFAAAFEERWAAELAALEQPARDLDGALLAAGAGAREALSRLEAVRLRLARAARPDHLLSTALEVDVTVPGPLEAVLTVDYVVPCALWRPVHRAFLTRDGGEASLRFELEAAVWQRTGEDWSDVALLFSTARPARRAEPPLLADDVLSVRRKVEKKVVVEVREQLIATTGEGTARTSDDLPGVDDGGESRLYESPLAATIPSDGLMRRVPLSSFVTRAEVDRIARAEKGALVHLRTRHENRASRPLLAGPVELHSEGAFVGRTQVGFVAPGERFALGWGGDPSLRVFREAREHRETGKILGKETITRTVELSLSNLDETPARFAVEERVPVSEIEGVAIEVVRGETVPQAWPDADGIVRWEVALAPLETRKLTLVTRITADRDVKGL